MKRSLLALLFMLPTIVTAEQEVSTSFQGYSGLINTPTAELFDSGKFYFQYGNQTEFEGAYKNTPNFHFGIGLWDLVEVSGRNAAHGDSFNGSSDLSANIKLGIPYIPKNWFSLAIGIQDIGGATNASLHDAKYIVASKDFFDNISLSAGLGQSESSQGRLDGVFGSISWQAYDWAKISLEYDAADTNLGLHLSTPQEWFNNGAKITANVLAYSTSEQLNDEFFYGVGIAIPLESSVKHNKPQQNARNSQHYWGQNHIDNTGSLTKLKNRLIKEGFESIKIGEAEQNTAYIELENHIYNRNQLDGLGVALGLISTRLGKEYTNFKLVLKEREVPILMVTGSIAEYRAFLNDQKPLTVDISTDTFDISTDTFDTQQNVRLADNKNANSSWLKPRFTFWPSLVSAVGTEYGMYDVSLGLVTHLELPLWPGGAVSALHMTQLTETEDFKDGRYFGDWKQKTGLQEYSLHQTFALPYNLKNMTFAGRYRESYNFLANEIRWQSGDGSHRINLLAAKYENQKVAERTPYQGCNILFLACWPPVEPKEREVMMGMYRYYSTKFDASAEIRVGQYWQQDKGVIFKLERMFGDVTINLSYKNTKIDNQRTNQFIGLGFSIPLTPRKDHSNKYVQVRGIPKWNYTIDTLVGLEGKNLNDLTPGMADSARMFYNLDNFYSNLDRLGKAYIYNNSSRLKQAFDISN